MRALSSFLLHVPGPGEEISKASVRQASHCTPSDTLTILKQRSEDVLKLSSPISSISVRTFLPFLISLSLMSFGSDFGPIVLSRELFSSIHMIHLSRTLPMIVIGIELGFWQVITPVKNVVFYGKTLLSICSLPCKR